MNERTKFEGHQIVSTNLQHYPISGVLYLLAATVGGCGGYYLFRLCVRLIG